MIPRNDPRTGGCGLVYVHVGPATGRGELLAVADAVGVSVVKAGGPACPGPQVGYRVDVFGPDPERVLRVAYFRGPDSLRPDAVAVVLAYAAGLVAADPAGRYGDVFVVDPAGRADFFDTVPTVPEVDG